MDYCQLTVTGRIGKIHGLRTDRYERVNYKFSMACNKVLGRDQLTLWLQVTVPDPLCLIVSERGLVVGENVLVATDFCELAATVQGNIARPWLNVTARQVVFLENPPALHLERGEGFMNDRVIDYSLLMALKATG